MGIIGIIRKMADSKIVEKVEGELTKKQNREQTSGYCKYIKTNLARVSKMRIVMTPFSVFSKKLGRN